MPGYVSSAPDLLLRDEPHPKDEADISTLDEILDMYKAERAFYNSNASLSLEPDVIKLFSVEQQLAINTKVVMHIDTITMKIQATINKIREKQSGREF